MTERAAWIRRLMGLILIGSSLLASASTAHAVPPTIPTWYWDEGHHVPLTLFQDRIGVVIRRAMSDSSLVLSLPPGFVVLQDLPSWIRILALPNAVPRDSINQLARTLEAGSSGTIAVAGLVVTHPGRYAPMLVTREFAVHFRSQVTKHMIDTLNASHNVEVVMRRPNRPGRYLLRAGPGSLLDGLALGNIYAATGLASLSHADFVHVVRFAYTPTDRYYSKQWHHDNTGDAGGTPDADLDTPLAWDITMGDSTAIVAVIDGGFDPNHPDLVNNLWVNWPEKNGLDGQDDNSPKNGYVDDVNGWDFYDCAWGCGDKCGQLDFESECAPVDFEDYHGTAVAGLVAAQTGTDEGVVGVCPDCRLMLLRMARDSERIAASFDYAVDNGATVITNSWVLTEGLDPDLRKAIKEAACASPYGTDCKARGGRGIPIFFAMGDDSMDTCGSSSSDIVQLDAVVGVGSSDNQDRMDRDTGWGDCMDVLAPSSGGTLNIMTTDHEDHLGYNTDWESDPSGGYLPPCPAGELTDTKNYIQCFGGTSAATPLVAGIAGLILSVAPKLTRVQVQNLIQDTADKIEPTPANYGEQTGFSEPTGIDRPHGFGRANAFEAVRIAARPPLGRGGVDLFLRDNSLDWGNTEQPSNTRFEDDPSTPQSDRGFIGHWASEDIRVDNSCPSGTLTSVRFDNLADRHIVAGATNCVYVRIRNRGFNDATSVTVKLYWADIGTVVPTLPSDFWTGFSTNTFTQTDWHFIGQKTISRVPYSGSSAARKARGGGSASGDKAKVVKISFSAPASLPNHYCLVAMVDSPYDHVAAYRRALAGQSLPSDFQIDTVTPTDNNVTQRNYQ